MKDVLGDIERWRARGKRVALATLVASRRSAPRPIGSKLAVSDKGELAGSVSGGCVEGDVYEHAREVLAGGPPKLVSYGIADEAAWEVGLPCGGEIDVFINRLDDDVVAWTKIVQQNGERGAVLTSLENGATALVKEGERADVDEIIRSGRHALVERPEGRTFVEVYAPPPRLLVFGAVDTAEALCRAAKLLGWRTIVADARARFATAERIPSADELVVAWPEEALERVDPDHSTAIVVLTHDERFDVPALAGALATEAFYVGALGSRRNQARRRELLLEAGVAEERIERIAGPSGLDIGAESQPETALSILAEILAFRAGRGGGPLKEATGRIHADAPA